SYIDGHQAMGVKDYRQWYRLADGIFRMLEKKYPKITKYENFYYSWNKWIPEAYSNYLYKSGQIEVFYPRITVVRGKRVVPARIKDGEVQVLTKNPNISLKIIKKIQTYGLM
ncbi:hypothetical protein LCGC14_0470830, partial [marine sediment metagenome]